MPYDFDKLATDLTAAAEHGDRESELLRGVAAQIEQQKLKNLTDEELQMSVQTDAAEVLRRYNALKAQAGNTTALQQQLTDAQARITALETDVIDPAGPLATELHTAATETDPTAAPVPAPGV